MHKMIMLIALMGFGIAGLSGQAVKQRVPMIRQIDQLLINSSDPATLFKFFSETIELPVVWPLAQTPQYTSGAVSTGNLTIEIFHYPGKSKESGARFSGLFLEPYPLSYILDELKYLRIPYSKPESHSGPLPNGKQGIHWTRVELPTFSQPAFQVFLYEYSQAFLKLDVRRRQLGNRLMLKNGGPLGLVKAQEIVISTSDPAKTRVAWELLLGRPDKSGAFTAGTGPAVRLVPGTEDRVQELVLKVKSPAEALQLLGPPRLQGLKLKLSQ